LFCFVLFCLRRAALQTDGAGISLTTLPLSF
jgi:hypothetical protein